MSVSITFDAYGDRVADRVELNLANGNFSTLWSALGLDLDWCGMIDPSDLQQRLKSSGPEFVERIERISNSGTFIECGITTEQAKRYFNQLQLVVDEAAKRGVDVVWY